jgi:hypothetical protein
MPVTARTTWSLLSAAYKHILARDTLPTRSTCLLTHPPLFS